MEKPLRSIWFSTQIFHLNDRVVVVIMVADKCRESWKDTGLLGHMKKRVAYA